MTHRDPADFDFSSPEVQRCPYPFYEALRESGAVHRLPSRDGVYTLSRHADVLSALLHPETFSSRRLPLGGDDPEFLAIAAEGHQRVATLTNNDPPSHSKYRKLINRTFTPRAVAAEDTEIRDLVNFLIDAFAKDGAAEFVAQFADQLPSYVLGNSLDQPREMAPQIKAWAKDITQAVNPLATREEALRYQRSFVEFQHYFAGQVEKKRVNPGDDFLTQIALADVDGELLSMEEVLDLLRVLTNGGNETMTSLLSSTMYHLLANPEQFTAVLADRSLIPAAVEEAMRIESPTQWFPRRLERDDAVVDGTTIPRGSQVIMLLGAANRDESVFPDADRFDIHRNTAGHLALGYGIHFCVGAPLARLEARIAFETLFDRLHDIRLAIPSDDVEFVAQPFIRQIEQLPLTFRPI